MSEQTLTILKKNGETFVISSNENMRVLTFLPSSPFYNTQYEKIDGQHGLLDLGGTFEAQDGIKLRIFFRSKDVYDFYLFRDQIFRLFASQEPFYVTSNREPGKQWKVRVGARYEIEPKGNGMWGVFDIIFKSASAFAESIVTTLDQFTFDSGKLQIGQGISAEELIYKHSTTNFRIFNAGDIEIDPRQLPLVIRIRGATNNLSVINRTTGDEWQYFNSSTSSDVIELNMVKSMKNGFSIFGQTNRKVIKIAAGWNDFIVNGINGSFQIEFDFRFYYLS